MPPGTAHTHTHTQAPFSFFSLHFTRVVAILTAPKKYYEIPVQFNSPY